MTHNTLRCVEERTLRRLHESRYSSRLRLSLVLIVQQYLRPFIWMAGEIAQEFPNWGTLTYPWAEDFW